MYRVFPTRWLLDERRGSLNDHRAAAAWISPGILIDGGKAIISHRTLYKALFATALIMSSLQSTAQSAAERNLPPMPQTDNPAISEGVNPNTKRVALKAWQLFIAAWDTGEWQPFLDMTTDDFEFYFPAGPHAGLHQGRNGKRMLVEWANFQQTNGTRLNSVTVHTTIGGNMAVFESSAESIPAGSYRNYEAIIFEVRGDKISALREYWNVLDPFTNAMQE